MASDERFVDECHAWSIVSIRVQQAPPCEHPNAHCVEERRAHAAASGLVSGFVRLCTRLAREVERQRGYLPMAVFFRELEERIRNLSGVQAVATTTSLPLNAIQYDGPCVLRDLETEPAKEL